ncbi:MAG: transcription antitermination factor NusB [Gammaproteobacteria bacterium]|jgi:N utilization substance protein B|nr:transcription antitermination factor NusB [Gammaproteobacteria bacterium]MBT6044011.1 transcription antitermination factor NusB [Gammaproteobacteria bacterium]
MIPEKPKIAHRKKARSLLVQALYQWQISDYPVNDIEAQYRTDNVGKIDWDYFHELFVGIVSSVEDLDNIFTPFLDREISQINPIELAILRLGAFELSQRIDIPYRVVINECIELAKKYGATDSHKYVNGVMDKMARKIRSVEINARAK